MSWRHRTREARARVIQDVIREQRERVDKEPDATVQRDGFTVPLIGIPKSSVMEKCDRCGETIDLLNAEIIQSGQVLCEKCKDKPL